MLFKRFTNIAVQLVHQFLVYNQQKVMTCGLPQPSRIFGKDLIVKLAVCLLMHFEVLNSLSRWLSQFTSRYATRPITREGQYLSS